MSGASLRRPETARQARTWQTMNNAAVAAGLCSRCAAQSAYGRQHGWGKVAQPCASCLSLVLALPLICDWPSATATDSAPAETLPLPVADAHALTSRAGEGVAA